MVNLTCGFSLQKAARIIAIIDIAYCFFSVIVRTAISVVQAIYAVQIPNAQSDTTLMKDVYQFNNDTMPFNTTSLANGTTTTTLAPVTVVLLHGSSSDEAMDSNRLNLDREEFSVDITHVFTFLLMLMAGIVLYIVFELWMCRLLLGAAKNLDRENVKRWWWYRLSMTLILMFLCIILTLVLNRGWFSWFMELVVFYRAYELVVIHLFKNEIGATSSRVQIGHFPQ